MKVINLIIIGLTISVLAGCVTTKKYELPVNVPTATVNANLLPASSRNSSTSVTFRMNGVEYSMFDVYSLKPQTFQPVKVQANQPVTFVYEQRFVDEVCTIRVNATLEPNKTYTVIDNTSFGKGLFNTGLLASKYCHFGVLDNQTGKLISDD